MQTTTLATKILDAADEKRLQSALALDYIITITSSDEREIRGFVGEYGVSLILGQAFCSCKDSMYRRVTCKHALALSLHTLSRPMPTPTMPESPINLAKCA